ncbi:MAG: hypothetical protein M1812_000176 [Candelaria pacifica]|nr:MAG: hypothetical protein M1812_000176 [Candelaria pacifica]
MPVYEPRALTESAQGKSKKQTMNDLKLRRLNELNLRLKEDLDRPRIRISEASKDKYALYATSPVPLQWGEF